MSKDVYQNLMNIMNSIVDIKKLQINALRTPLDRNINMNGHNINNANIINSGTLNSLSLYGNTVTTNTITTNSSNGLYINSTNYSSGTVALLTVKGYTSGNINYPNYNIFKVNNNGSVIIGTYETLGQTAPALTVYGSIDIEDGGIYAPNIISSINNMNNDTSIRIGGTYINKTLALANPLNNIQVVSGTISSLSTNLGSIPNLIATTGTISSLSTNLGSIPNLIAPTGTISSLSTNLGSIPNLIAPTGTINSLYTNLGSMTNLIAPTGTISSLYNSSGSIPNLIAPIGTIVSLSINSGTIPNLFINPQISSANLPYYLTIDDNNNIYKQLIS